MGKFATIQIDEDVKSHGYDYSSLAILEDQNIDIEMIECKDVNLSPDFPLKSGN